jgi:hypothetical protein
MSKQNQNQNQNRNQTQQPRATPPAPPAEQVNNTEETIAAVIRDARREIKNALKGNDAIAKLPDSPAMKDLKTQMIAALSSQKETIAKATANRVYSYLMKTEA